MSADDVGERCRMAREVKDRWRQRHPRAARSMCAQMEERQEWMRDELENGSRPTVPPTSPQTVSREAGLCLGSTALSQLSKSRKHCRPGNT